MNSNDEILIKFPKKSEHRQRAHCNPLSINSIPHPKSCDHVDYSLHFPGYFTDRIDGSKEIIAANTEEYPADYSKLQSDNKNGKNRNIDFIDVGCGYGGMMYAVAKEFKDKLILGMEIREKLSNFVAKKIIALRKADPGNYNNVSVIRTNAMQYFSLYIRPKSVEKLFFLFADPHFKKRKFKRRIINENLLNMYSRHLKNDARIYIITDVKDLYDWIVKFFDNNPNFSELDKIKCAEDICYKMMHEVTDEGKKAVRLGKKLYSTVYQYFLINDESNVKD